VEGLLFEVAVEAGDKEVFEGTEYIFFNVFELSVEFFLENVLLDFVVETDSLL
jgi:hypothetical protein